MHDDRALVEARLARVLTEKIRPLVRGSRQPLAVEAWEVPDEPVPVADALAAAYEPFAIGSLFGRPWGTTWFHMTGRVPADWVGERVEASIDLSFTNAPGFQAEATVWGPVDGGSAYAPQRGLHPLNHHLDVADPAIGGERIDLLVEAASNPDLTAHRPSPNSDVLTAGSDPLYALRRAELVVVNVDVYDLREDIRALSGLMQQLPLDGPRRHEILRALERMLDVLVLDDVPGSAGAARDQLAEVLARPASASAHRISAIAHAHIDSAWLWPIRETRRKCARTFSGVLALMDRYPELRFACSSAAQYQWVLDEHPALFEGIRKRVADGRWMPVGGMWVEPDVNLASGESLIRQITYGQRFFEEHFGVRSTEVWIPDVFGYSAALPQIMRLGGLRRFLTQKMSWNKTNPFPHHTFWWEGIDGSSVFTHFPPIDSYNALVHPTQHAHAERTFTEKGRATRSLMPFGFGDGGGGPSRTMLEQLRRLRDIEGGPRLEIESPEQFFDGAEAEYPDAPRWVGELYFETHRGTYTSQAKTKLGNRRCELLLREAELWCVAALGTTESAGYPKVKLDGIWTDVLLHQFHDILPGSSIAWVHRQAEETYARLQAELEEIIVGALAHLTGGGMSVANAAPHDRSEVLLVGSDGGGALPADTRDLVTQSLADGSIAVPISVPALSVLPFADSLATTDPRPVRVIDSDGATVIDNGTLRVEIDGDGLLASVVVAGREIVVPGQRANLLQLHPDFPAEYDAWDLDASYRRQVTNLTAASSVEVVDTGPLVARVRVDRSFRSSQVTQTYELRAGARRLDVHTVIDWHERDHVLKAAFPLDLQTDHLTREIQLGHVRSAIHTNTSWDAARFEVCAHRWVDASEPGFGVALLNDAKYGHDATRTRSADDRPTTTMRLTLLKGAQYPDPNADEGRHDFAYALMPHAGDLRDAGVIEEGYRLNMPLRIVGTGSSPPGAPKPPAVRSGHAGVIVETVKPADDDSGDLVVRLYEAWGARSPLRVQLATAPSSVTVVDLLEEESDSIPTVALTLDGATVTGELRPFQIVTLRIRA